MLKVPLTTKNRLGQAGFSVIEVLLAATVFGMLVTALVGAIVYGRAATADSGDHRRAVLVAQEGLDATRNIGNASFANLTTGTFGLAQASGTWTLSGTSDNANGFTRQITIASVDTNRKTITSTVTWQQQGGGIGTVTLTARLTNWLAATSLPKTWPNAILAGSADISGTSDGYKVAVYGNYAFIVLNTIPPNNFVVANISNPAAPSIVATTSLNSGAPSDIVISSDGHYAYVADLSDIAEFQVVDISTPTAPVYKTSLDLPGTANPLSLALVGNTVFMGRIADTTKSSNEVASINVSTPTAPTIAGGYNNNSTAITGLYYPGTGNYLFAATNVTSTEMLVLNISTPATPTLGASYNAPTAVAATAISGYGNTVLLGLGTTLNAVNIATPTSPANISSFTAAGTINDIAVDSTNQFGFLATSATSAEFQVINVGTPSSMTLAKSVDVPGTTSTLNGIAYSSSADIVVGASFSDTQELLIFTKN